MRVARYLAAAAVLGACTNGSVRIVVDTPEDPALDPADDRLATITLRAEVDGQEAVVNTRSADGRADGLDLGRVPLGQGVTLSLSAFGAAGQLIGYGRALPLDVELGADVDV